MKKILGVLTLLAVVVLAGYLYLRWQWGPYGPGGSVYIPPGATVEEMSQILDKAQIIRSPWSFKLLVRLEEAGRSLQAGEYAFDPGVSATQVLDKLRRGDRVVHYLTIPEGYNFSQIAEAIGKTGIATVGEVQKTFRDPKYLQRLKFPAQSLEGYLFPATYPYDRGTQLDGLINDMIDRFLANFDEKMRSRMDAGGWTIPQVTTLASIIEKETGKAEERPRIAAVFHNRLKIGMPLQSDPTIIYGLKDFDGNIRKPDIRNPHPYNTYVHLGLPPGPIASPGTESLKAVLYPDQSDELFFVARGDGSHQFSKTLSEHQEAVKQYQLKRGGTTSPTSPEGN